MRNYLCRYVYFLHDPPFRCEMTTLLYLAITSLKAFFFIIAEKLCVCHCDASLTEDQSPDTF